MSVKTEPRGVLRKSRLFAAACAGAVTLSASLSANAAFVLSGGPSKFLPINGNDFNSNLQAEGFSQMSTDAQLSVDQDGSVTFYYIAAESTFNNSFHTASAVMTEKNDAFKFDGYDSITINVSEGDVLDFSFQSDGGIALSPVDNAAPTNLGGLGIMTGDGMSELVLAYNDNITLTGAGMDADYDDMLVRAEFSAVVPVPAAMWLFGSGLLGLIGAARRKA